MRQDINRNKIVFIFIIVCWSLFSMTFMWMPLTQQHENASNQGMIAVGLFFWITFVLSIIGVMIYKKIRKENRKQTKEQQLFKVKRGVYLGVKAAFIMAMIGMLIIIIIGKQDCYITYVDISVLVYSAGLCYLLKDLCVRKERKKL
jgi:uncharacterized membrane protein